MAITAEWQACRAEALANGALNLRALTPSAIGHDEVKRELEDPPTEREDEDGDAEPQVAAAEARSLAMRRGNAIHEALALSVAEDRGRDAAPHGARLRAPRCPAGRCAG